MADGLAEDSITVVLRKPLVLEGKTITELVIKEPSAGDMAMAENSGKKGMADQGIILLGLAANLHPSVVKQLGAGDFIKAQKALASFFEDGQETGESLLPS